MAIKIEAITTPTQVAAPAEISPAIPSLDTPVRLSETLRKEVESILGKKQQKALDDPTAPQISRGITGEEFERATMSRVIRP